MDAVYILAHEILALPWANAWDWQGLADQARALLPADPHSAVTVAISIPTMGRRNWWQ